MQRASHTKTPQLPQKHPSQATPAASERRSKQRCVNAAVQIKSRFDSFETPQFRAHLGRDWVWRALRARLGGLGGLLGGRMGWVVWRVRYRFCAVCGRLVLDSGERPGKARSPSPKRRQKCPRKDPLRPKKAQTQAQTKQNPPGRPPWPCSPWPRICPPG